MIRDPNLPATEAPLNIQYRCNILIGFYPCVLNLAAELHVSNHNADHAR
jgi:hypothetical protein